MRALRPVVAALMTLAALGRASGQDLPRLVLGQRVRVTAPAAGLRKQTGVLLALTPDTLVVGALGDQVVVGVAPFDTMGTKVPLAMVHVLEVSAGRAGHPWIGAAVGGVAGAAVGAIAGWAAGDDPPNDQLLCDLFLPCPPSRSAGEKAALGAAIGLGAGALLGRFVGQLLRTEAWAKVPLERIRLVVRPAPGGLAVAASLTF
jgi:hypothetical protein